MPLVNMGFKSKSSDNDIRVIFNRTITDSMILDNVLKYICKQTNYWEDWRNWNWIFVEVSVKSPKKGGPLKRLSLLKSYFLLCIESAWNISEPLPFTAKSNPRRKKYWQVSSTGTCTLLRPISLLSMDKGNKSEKWLALLIIQCLSYLLKWAGP